MDLSRFPCQLVLYAGCCLLVVIFVHLFPLLSLIRTSLPEIFLTIVPIAAVCSLVLLPIFLKLQGMRMQYSLVTVGALLCLYALSLPNAAYPYKRIHVLEYMSLALAVRYVMSWKLQGRALLFFSVLATMAFGIHDELLQGIHPQRTYGLRDVTVDAVSALGGGLLWNGLALFSRPHTTWYPEDTPAQWRPALFYLFWLVLSVLGFILPLPGYKNGVLPYWILIPLTASLVFWALYHFQLPGKARYGCGVLSCQVFSFFCYPFVINAYSLPFY